jgi:hypothetical protein
MPLTRASARLGGFTRLIISSTCAWGKRIGNVGWEEELVEKTRGRGQYGEGISATTAVEHEQGRAIAVGILDEIGRGCWASRRSWPLPTRSWCPVDEGQSCGESGEQGGYGFRDHPLLAGLPDRFAATSQP